jgi:hypothetical protein
MNTFTIIFTDFNGKGQRTIVRAENGSQAFAWALRNISTINPRRKMGAFPREDNFA